jgi:hypothetical protein
MKNRVYVLVSIELPPYAHEDEVAEYVLDATKSYAGGLHPDEPMFHIDRDSVRLTVISKDAAASLI